MELQTRNQRPPIAQKAELISPGCPAWPILCCSSILQKKEIDHLRTKESWELATGRSSETLVKQQDFRVILI